MSGIIGTSHSKSKVIGRSQDTAKAWIRFVMSTQVVVGSFNVSSISDTATGQTTLNFANALANANWVGVANSNHWAGSGMDKQRVTTWSTTAGVCMNIESGGYVDDTSGFSCIIFGD